jgi:glutathione S-transferase
MGKESFEGTLKAVEALQEQLSPEGKGKFVVGDQLTIADAATVPFLARMEVALSNDFGLYAEGEGRKVYETLSTSPKYARFWKYFQDLKSRESFKKTFDEVSYGLCAKFQCY